MAGQSVCIAVVVIGLNKRSTLRLRPIMSASGKSQGHGCTKYDRLFEYRLSFKMSISIVI